MLYFLDVPLGYIPQPGDLLLVEKIESPVEYQTGVAQTVYVLPTQTHHTSSQTPPNYYKGDWVGKVFLGSD